MTRNEPTARKATEIDPTRSELDNFLADMMAAKKSDVAASGRLIFALDATRSRQETWDAACSMQGDMFRTVASIGGLNVQLVYYRGLDECRASRWVTDPEQLAKLMTRIDCRSGHTQIGKVLTHTKRETGLLKVAATVFVGDAFEEDADEIVPLARELGQLNTPAFMVQEGNSRTVERVFRDIAKASGGAYCRFDDGSADQLRELLKLVATFAVGGKAALEASKSVDAVKLLSQLR